MQCCLVQLFKWPNIIQFFWVWMLIWLTCTMTVYLLLYSSNKQYNSHNVFTWVMSIRLAGCEGRDGRCFRSHGSSLLLGRDQTRWLSVQRCRVSFPQRFLIGGRGRDQHRLGHLSFFNHFRLGWGIRLSAESNRWRHLFFIDWFSFLGRC